MNEGQPNSKTIIPGRDVRDGLVALDWVVVRHCFAQIVPLAEEYLSRKGAKTQSTAVFLDFSLRLGVCLCGFA